MQKDKEILIQLLDELATIKIIFDCLESKELKSKLQPKLKALETELETIFSEMTK